MHASSRSIAASEIQTILNADITALELWIEEKKKDVRLLASRDEIREAILDLVQIAEQESSPAETLRSSQALTRLRIESEKFDRIVGRPEHDGVLTRDGLVVANQTDDAIGERMNAEGIAALTPVYQGETIFLRPQPEGAFILENPVDLNHPVVFVVAPVRRDESDDSEVIAAAAFGFPADEEFTDILSVARQGRTGETYTFDENGLLLSESRFDDELRESGLLPDERNVRSIFRIEIRDPGNREDWRTTSSLEAAARPLTRLAATAIAAGRKGSAAEQQGVILDPYRNLSRRASDRGVEMAARLFDGCRDRGSNGRTICTVAIPGGCDFDTLRAADMLRSLSTCRGRLDRDSGARRGASPETRAVHPARKDWRGRHGDCLSRPARTLTASDRDQIAPPRCSQRSFTRTI